MRAVLLRRMMVLGVCALGVSALYLVPGLIGPTAQVGVPAPGAEAPPATTRPAPDSSSAAARAVAPSATSAVDEVVDEVVDTASDAPLDEPAAKTETSSEQQTTTERAEARSDGGQVDEEQPATADPPTPVSQLEVRTADADQVEVAWAPSSDESGEVSYRVWLNGYEVEQTKDTRATVEWFNDDSQQQVVTVRAVDGDGNQSRTAATLLLTRPEPGAPSTGPATDPTPSPPAASPAPSAAPGSAGDADGSDEPADSGASPSPSATDAPITNHAEGDGAN